MKSKPQSAISRRSFVSCVMGSVGTAGMLSLEEQVLLGKESTAKPTVAPASQGSLPTGKIGDLQISRLILGGNLIVGFAHSRELVYVSNLLKHYFTPEKVLDTLALAESHGINCVNTNPSAMPIMQRYFRERGGKMKWIVQAYPHRGDHQETIKEVIDAGAEAVYIQGGDADRLVKDGKIDELGKVVDFIKLCGVPAGVAGHTLRVAMECEKTGVKADFYVKTLHTDKYFSFQPNQTEDVGKYDNMWCANANEVVAFMKKVEKPWIAYKVMAAGAIPPAPAFRYAFESGADFVLAGMFDFQIAEDVNIARQVLAKVKRERPWRA